MIWLKTKLRGACKNKIRRGLLVFDAVASGDGVKEIFDAERVQDLPRVLLAEASAVL